jgi:hypothetical protein
MSSIARKTRRVSRWAGIFVGGCLALGATGCFFESSTDAGPAPTPVPPPLPPGPAPGSLTLQWTVEGRTDPNLCVLGNASTFDVILTTSAGQFVGEFQAACGAFATSVSSLAPGGYYGSAELLDASGRPRTTSIAINAFTIVENSDLVVDLDFPADSFL